MMNYQIACINIIAMSPLSIMTNLNILLNPCDVCVKYYAGLPSVRKMEQYLNPIMQSSSYEH